jgi:hypothetical protein
MFRVLVYAVGMLIFMSPVTGGLAQPASFCPALKQLVAAAQDGFKQFRGKEIQDVLPKAVGYDATVALPGFNSCYIRENEDTAPEYAVYFCAFSLARYQQVREQVTACLANEDWSNFSSNSELFIVKNRVPQHTAIRVWPSNLSDSSTIAVQRITTFFRGMNLKP